MESNNTSDEYFEIRKIKLEEFEKFEKKQKTILLRRNIAIAVVTITTSALVGTKGYNPFLAFAQAYSLPVGGLIYANIKTLAILKKMKMDIMNGTDYSNEESDINRRKSI